MTDEMDRELTYLTIFEEVDLLRTTVDHPIYDANEMDLLVRVSALTEAVLRDKITLGRAKKLIRDYIERLKAPPMTPEEPVQDGSIKF